MRVAYGEVMRVGGSDGEIEESSDISTRPDRVEYVGSNAAVRIPKVVDQIGQ